VNKKFLLDFRKKGFFIGKLNLIEKVKLDEIKKKIINILKKKLKKNVNLENFHNIIEGKYLNSIRLEVFNKINKNKFNLEYYNMLSRFIEPIVGSENVIQKKINLSIQLPKDDTSLLPVHSDTWAGDSPFEIVIWLPLVDSKKTQSMFILPRDSKNFINFHKFTFKRNSEIMKKIKKDIQFINIKYGEVLVFSQNLPHGNVVNTEKKTRWSFNARVKSLMSPYSQKNLLDFFEIIELKPATEFGLLYEYPKFK
jgi:sporadic carbohydrate cluster 2OG-Fe(II) oxygenase